MAMLPVRPDPLIVHAWLAFLAVTQDWRYAIAGLVLALWGMFVSA